MISSLLAPLLLTLATLAQTAPGDTATATTAQAPQTAPVPQPTQDSPVQESEAPLQDHEVARIDGVSISADTFYRYLSLVYARLPEGNQALDQLLLEEILQQRAAAAGITVEEAEVDEVFAELDARAREATDGAMGLADSVGPERAEALRHGVSLATMHRKLVAHEQGLERPADVDDAMLQDWLDRAFETADVQEASLGDAIAVTWSGGSLTRATVGARIAQILTPADLTGLLTELLGIHAIRHRAAVMGIEVTPEAAADELLERQQQVSSNPDAAGVSYADIVGQVYQRSTAELVASPKFGAEVLLRLMVDIEWDEPSLASLFESQRSLFQEQLGGPVEFEQARFAVIKKVRQGMYQQLLAASSIVRRF